MQRIQEASGGGGRLTNWILTAPMINSFSAFVPLRFVGDYVETVPGQSEALNLENPKASKLELAKSLLEAYERGLIRFRQCRSELSAIIGAMDSDSLEADYTLTVEGVNLLEETVRPNWTAFVDRHSLLLDDSTAEVVAADIEIGKLYLKAMAEDPFSSFRYLNLDASIVEVVQPWNPYPFPIPIQLGYRIRSQVLMTIENPYSAKLEEYHKKLLSRIPSWITLS